MPFAASIAFAVSLALNATVAAPASTFVSIMPAAQTPKEYVESYFSDIPIMVKVAQCESRYTQFNADGSVHRGEINDQDIGIMQVNEHYHAATADKLGLDIYTLQGNVAYARYLYEKQGTQPWSSSKPCWGKYESKLSSNINLVATAQK